MKHASLIALVVITSALWMSCQTPPTQPAFAPTKLAEIDAAVAGAIHEKKIPGGVLWLERNGARYVKAYGSRALIPAPEPMTDDTIFDIASLTKVVATAPSIALLIERGKIELDSPASEYLPAFTSHGKDTITVRHLLTHTSGLRPGLSPTPDWWGAEKALELACAEKPLNAPGKVFRYSDINFIVLGAIVERVSGSSLDEFARREIYLPLGMSDTGFRPSLTAHPRIAPTELVGTEMLRGTVHDPTARRMGGVAGHAGLFSTASDLARFARMMLNGGSLDGVRIFTPETVRLMTSVQSPDAVPARRGMGWDIDSPYSRPRGRHYPLGSYGHTGWTGTSIWIDPFSRTFWMFLSNRVHPDGKGNVLPLQATLANLTAEAVVGFNFAGVTGALPPRPSPDTAETRRSTSRAPRLNEVLNGVDVLAEERFRPFAGKRIGLITNHTGHDRHRRPTIDLLYNAPDVKLVALFSPEHGIRGALDERIPDGHDPRTGLPIYSLYGEHRAPQPDQLRGIDLLVFDIQDIGCRFYTYISTLGNCLEAAAKAGIPFHVLDRINPINGVRIDGPVLNSETSFTAYHPIPVRHGMTVGELARMFNAERGFNAELTVTPARHWTRDMWMDEAALPWTNPSPNMRSLTQATLYPGIGLLETTALSVGRGTDTPFEVIGAPYIDDVVLAFELNRAGLPWVRFVPVRFTPRSSVFKDQECGGVSIILLDRTAAPTVEAGILIARTLHRLYPEDFDLDRFNRLLGHRATIEAIRDGKSIEEIRQIWQHDLQEFMRRRQAYLLYS